MKDFKIEDFYAENQSTPFKAFTEEEMSNIKGGTAFQGAALGGIKQIANPFDEEDFKSVSELSAYAKTQGFKVQVTNL